MDNMIEIEGKTVDDAIEKACREFGVPREKLSIDIISEGTSGFLGLGSKKAKVRAGLLTLDINDDMRPSSREEKKDQLLAVDDEVRRPSRGEKKERPRAQEREPVISSASAGHIEPSAAAVVADDVDNTAGLKAKELLEGLLELMAIPCPVSLIETEDSIILNIKGDGDGLLIGKRGQNLDAIQHFINKATNKTANSKKLIVVDTEAYRKRREESLVTLAERLGQKVKKTKKTVTVSNMNAHDRRIIHMALQGDAALQTKSRGEGEYRKIIIMPAKREREPGHQRRNALPSDASA
ncbi:MAG: Jag N-terminal domain-containing protein [Syntrophales bacterium]|nr:Jag N-terminal domain-containing protein [Syntrophales bacterium]